MFADYPIYFPRTCCKFLVRLQDCLDPGPAVRTRPRPLLLGHGEILGLTLDLSEGGAENTAEGHVGLKVGWRGSRPDTRLRLDLL